MKELYKSISLLHLFLLAHLVSYAQSYVGGYIRVDRLETGQISNAVLLKNTDLMVLGFNPKSDGHLKVTANNATFGSGTSRVSSFSGRSGVISFNGNSTATMNAGVDLLTDNAAFTFATWLYVNNQSTYVPGKFIFKKTDGSKEVSLRVGGNYGQLIFRVIDGSTTYQASANAPVTGILSNAWNHIAITFNGAAASGSQVKLFVNGEAKTMTASGAFPAALPATTTNLVLGENFSGYLDEPLVNDLALNEADIDQFVSGNYPFNTFNLTKTSAFWNFDDASNPGFDLRSYVTTFSRIRTIISGTSIKLHMTVSGGSWQTAISTATGRTNFINDISAIVTSQNLDGVDIDLEWPTANTESAFSDYSTFVVALRSALGSGKVIALSLHPAYYKVGTAAINAANHLALQMYGPQTTWWSYSQFVAGANAAISYGIPKAKLIMGLPFFATTGVAGEQIGYRDIITANPSINVATDQVVYNGKTYTFNGVSTIEQKAAYVCQNDLGGIMSWDLPLDVADYNSSYSLLKAAVTSLNSCSTAAISSVTTSFRNEQLIVQWTAAPASTGAYYLVQGSVDNINFTTIDSIKAVAKSQSAKQSVSYYSRSSPLLKANTPVRKMGLSFYLGCLLVVLGWSAYNPKNRSQYLVLSCLMLSMTLGACKKQDQVTQNESDFNYYIRIVKVEADGQKVIGPTVTVSKTAG